MMDYVQTANWMFNQLPMYQQQGASAYRKDLTNTLRLMEHLGHPEREIRCIHVAGTNGKGSTSHMLASVLMEAGYKVGLYTSPHLKDFRERITVNGQMIPEDAVVEFIAKNKSFFEENNLSFFEMTVGLAFDYFRKSTDICVIETGMGGRLDSTNVITPILSIITNIGLDHTAFLGDTLEEIAGEKAGIIKPNVPVVIGEHTDETRPVFLQKSTEVNAPISFASDAIVDVLPGDLLGDYQIANKKTVQQAVAVLQESGLAIDDAHLQNGLINTAANTNLQGRWQIVRQNPTVIVDTAHNKHGLEVVMKQLLSQSFGKLHFVLGVVSDKDLSSTLPLLPKNAKYYFCRPNIPRGLDALELERKASSFGLKGSVYDSVSEAYQNAIKNAGPKDLIYAGGSTFVVAEIL
jgi:dihydrofolate synthase/folylpolyglutamate synthase